MATVTGLSAAGNYISSYSRKVRTNISAKHNYVFDMYWVRKAECLLEQCSEVMATGMGLGLEHVCMYT